ncbi:MAG: hypothetical protein WC343_15675 [Bacilli bacterium]|jgi:hypothetical protein
MILTEEQRAALKRVIAYMNRMYGIASPYYGCTEDANILRAMIDSSDQFVDVTKLIERLAAGEHEQWAAWAQAILDSEPGLSDNRKAAWPGLIATQYENLSEEMKDKDRREVHLRSSVALDIVQQQAARIKELEAQCEDLMQNCNSLRERAWKAEVRIKEQDDALVEERTGAIRCESYDHCEGMYRIDLPDAMIRAQQELQAEGKIGPDAAKPQSWQITEERKVKPDDRIIEEREMELKYMMTGPRCYV